MTQSISSQGFVDASVRPAVALERWGLPAEHLAALLARLADAMPCVDWYAAQSAPAGALALHLVDFAQLAGNGRAVWNACGPLEAMRQARLRGQPAFALCRGRASQLPAVRRGVWVLRADNAWEVAVQSLVRALAVLEWTHEDGYKAVSAWRGAAELAQRNLLAVTGADKTASAFSSVLRDALAASLMPPAALTVAGAPDSETRRTIIEAGLHDLQTLAVTPMTLDGRMRVDALLGFEWPVLD